MKIAINLTRIGIPVRVKDIIDCNRVDAIVRSVYSEKKAIGRWIDDEYNPNKPIIIIPCGVTSEYIITSHLNNWREYYNIYVIEPVFNISPNYEGISYHELLNLIKADIYKSIPANASILCILGFSFGGELAYHLAASWEKEKGESPMVLMGDTIIADLSSVDFPYPNYNDNYERYYYQLLDSYFAHLQKPEVPYYSGPVVLVSACGDQEPRQHNENKWNMIDPHIKIIQINETHSGLYQKQEYYKTYLSLIQDYKY